MYWFQSVALGQTYLNRYFSSSFSQVNRYLKGTLYVAPIISEVSPTYAFTGKIKKLSEIGNYTNNNIIITTQSSTKLKMPENCVDYIFVDPPFGGNIMYSELNFIWESWLNVYTNNKDEAIKNDYQKKGLQEYQELMERCFKEFYHILKPNRWITVEFHNSKNSIWIAIQEALNKAGFIIADVRTLDKKQRTMKQMTTINAVEQDLIISAYKPKTSVEKQILNSLANNENTWIFINNHLKNLPIAVETDNVLESVVERQPYLLYDRMVAFYVQRGIKVPLSAGEFYSGMHRRYPKRDDMYFLPEQVAEYDRKRMTAKNIEQLSLFVHDEKSTVQWLRKELNIRPQTYQEIQPKFLRELHKSGHEQLPELQEVLEENFLKNELGEWYIPDPLKQTDLEKIREKALLREFQTYRDAKGKLRIFRSEAVRTGFSRCWADVDYEGIIKVAEKLPEDVLQEDPTLLMYYDNALTRRSN